MAILGDLTVSRQKLCEEEVGEEEERRALYGGLPGVCVCVCVWGQPLQRPEPQEQGRLGGLVLSAHTSGPTAKHHDFVLP